MLHSLVRSSLFAVAVCLFGSSPSLHAQDAPDGPALLAPGAATPKATPKPKPAEVVDTDPQHADADYPFQGEYKGWLLSSPGSTKAQSVGLQVVARGDGRFEAAKIFGGLPGERSVGNDREPFSGSRQQQTVTLIGSRETIVIEQGVATIFSARDDRIGELRKIVRISPTMGARPPQYATVLFDGGSTNQFVNARLTHDGLLMAGTVTAQPWDNFRLHAEFRLPYKPFARDQARGNSGFYLQSRYEVQVLDSFGLEPVYNGCGALYRTQPPQINMCLPPLQWQTYDIDFTPPQFDDDGQKTANARINVWHNGVAIHDRFEIPNKTGAGKQEAPNPLPTKIQDHGNPVTYRNLWIIDKTVPLGGTGGFVL